MPVQQYNGDLYRIGKPNNQARYDPAIGYAEANNMFLSPPGLVGFWPCNAQGSSSSSITELSDFGPRRLNLTRNGSPALTASSDKLAVWQQFNGSTDWYSHADATAFDITDSLAIMAWVKFDNAAVATEQIACKWTGSNLSYALFRASTGVGRFAITTNGTTVVSVDTAAALDANKWYFLVGRFSPGVEIKIWWGSISNINSAANTTSIPASIFNGTALFGIGAQSGGANFLDGAISRVGLYNPPNFMFSDAFVETVFQRTRQIYGAI